MTRRPIIALATALCAIALFAGALAWLLDTPRPRPGATHAERLFLTLCAPCHGEDGRGSWRAALFLVRPGDLTDRSRMQMHTDRYLFDLIKHGGSPVGRPGMPGFERLDERDVETLVRYLRTLRR